jgi:hypothetical protein
LGGNAHSLTSAVDLSQKTEVNVILQLANESLGSAEVGKGPRYDWSWGFDVAIIPGEGRATRRIGQRRLVERGNRRMGSGGRLSEIRYLSELLDHYRILSDTLGAVTRSSSIGAIGSTIGPLSDHYRTIGLTAPLSELSDSGRTCHRSYHYRTLSESTIGLSESSLSELSSYRTMYRTCIGVLLSDYQAGALRDCLCC